MNERLDAAHAYAHRGWRVVPLHCVTPTGACTCRSGISCPSIAKHPIHSDWGNLASTSGADVEAWWEDRPDAGVGIVTGAESGIWVLDIDGVRGLNSLQELVNDHGPLPRTRIHRTGSGGLHYMWAWPDFTVQNSTHWLGPGIDVRGMGGQIVAPPSVSGRGTYRTMADHDPVQAPVWLLDLVQEHSVRYARGKAIDPVPAAPVDVSFLPPDVLELAQTLIGEDEGRYRHFHALVAACRRAGYSMGQAVTIARPWCQAVKKFVGRVEAEVARSWGKLDDEDERQKDWLPDLGAAAVDGTSALQPEPAAEPEPAADADAETTPASWAPVDLTGILSGTYTPEVPALLPRADGNALLYPGRVHSMHGESESGKSLIAQAEAARLIADGADVLYIDFEADAPAVAGRLLELGAPADGMLAHFTYLRPDVDPRRFENERAAFATMVGKPYSLAVLDGMTDALGVFGASSKDNDDVAAFMRTLPRNVATRTGAAVVLIDHVAKDADSRGRFAIGGQAKMAGLDGSAFIVEIDQAIGRGMSGTIVLRVAKDRPGGVRPHCGPFRKADRTQEAARITVDSTNGGIKVIIGPPSAATPESKLEQPRRTYLMEKVSRYLQTCPAPVSQTHIEQNVSGTTVYVREALQTLVEEGYVERAAGKKGFEHSLVKPFDKAKDEAAWLSDQPRRHPVGTPSEWDRGNPVGAPPPLRGGDGVTGLATEPTPSDLDVACQECFTPTPRTVADATGGLCMSCVGGDR